MPVVLVHNEQTAGGRYDFWKDVEGSRYHFPNQYKNRMKEGDQFIYYRGVRRKSGRGQAEYFGTGTIGTIYFDYDTEHEPKPKQAFYADLGDYVEFPEPVKAIADGPVFENIASNEWGVGVRTISQETFDAILRTAGLVPSHIEHIEALDAAPSPDHVRMHYDDRLLVPRPPSHNAGSTDSIRWSRLSTRIGTRAEELIYRLLIDQGMEGVKWLARDGITPGFDIEYRDSYGNTIGVEVKGTTGVAFTSLELTANEFEASRRMRSNYHIYLVSKCLAENPHYFVLVDPATRIEGGDLVATPSAYTIRLT